MIEAYRVSWLTRYLKELIESDLRLSNIWLEGEVSNLTRSSAGHLYFTLKDEEAQLRCVMFRRSHGGAPVENGAQVLAHGNVSLYEARGDLQLIVDFVQPAGIVAALRRLNDETEIDVIILARGGGSIEELWPFNEEIVARAVYGSRVPVVSGVGHETDHTMADYVADVRAPTPSAAAETALPDRPEVSRRIEGLALALHAWTAGRVNQGRAGMGQALERLRRVQPEPARLRERLAALVLATEVAVERAAARRDERLSSFAAQLRSLDPRRTLARGYAVVQMREDRQAVTSVGQVRGRDRLTVHVRDGNFPAEVSKQYGF